MFHILERPDWGRSQLRLSKNPIEPSSDTSDRSSNSHHTPPSEPVIFTDALGFSPHVIHREFEIVRVILLGSPAGVRDVQYELQRLRFAHLDEWSRFLPNNRQIPEPRPGDVMTILTKRRSLNSPSAG